MIEAFESSVGLGVEVFAGGVQYDCEQTSNQDKIAMFLISRGKLRLQKHGCGGTWYSMPFMKSIAYGTRREKLGVGSSPERVEMDW